MNELKEIKKRYHEGWEQSKELYKELTIHEFEQALKDLKRICSPDELARIIHDVLEEKPEKKDYDFDEVWGLKSKETNYQCPKCGPCNGDCQDCGICHRQ